MILWRPSEHFKRYAYYNQGTTLEDNYDDDEAQEFNAPDTFAVADNVTRRGGNNTTRGGDSDTDETPDEDENKQPTFAIGGDDGDDDDDDQFRHDDKPKTTLAQTIEITEDQSAKID
eukprot:CAMPEP_0201567430 /NCGR_PEP_ID=MMETSP0190_2-20130828/7938_1 /ASSEMBLY_ACC=CAM_ASM_000263 /TAXON_ID=37353 /ORGANISM="Rosalina sp." /LENGTH=116 /DNA_ID=CAMNT_0047987439 /DNA_START=1487 /DNA_END=1837 /DNA_ORIENTATION=+